MKNDFPCIGFGTWKLKNSIQTTSIIEASIQSGYRLFDTAAAYQNEESIGNAFANTSIAREQLYISGKLWNDDRNNVMDACKSTIYKLRCDYLDLYLMHWPASKAVHDDWEVINAQVWQQMSELVQAGLVKQIGVSNFKMNQLQSLQKHTSIMPFVNQIELHPGFIQRETVNYCQENAITIQAWSPLGSGRLLKKQPIKELARKYGKTEAQICLTWCIQNGFTPIVRSSDPDRMKSNLDIFDFRIADQDLNDMNELPCIYSSGLDSETITLFN